MRKLALTTAAVAALALASPASAETIQGTIASYDAAAQQVTLQSGETFKLQPGLDAMSLIQGAKVTLNVEKIGEAMVVTEVQVN
jgi:Cu/Ag efflux protein CusF